MELGFFSQIANDTSIKKQINFNINYPIYIELNIILNNSPLDDTTQIKIEEIFK